MLRALALSTLLIAAVSTDAAQASNQPGNPGQIPQPPQPIPVGPVFVYVIKPGQTNPTGDPLEQLREARITVSGPRRAYDIKALGDNTGDGSPETYLMVAAAPGNRRAIAYSVQTPIDAIDHDLRVFDLALHKQVLFFNEHTLQSQVHRATCPSKQLDAFIAQEQGKGVPKSTTDTYDYKISIDGQDAANVPQILLVEWVNNTTVHLQWPQLIVMGPPNNMGVEVMETFDFQIRVTGPGAPKLLTCAAPASLLAPPRPVLAITPPGGGSNTIKLDGVVLNFPPIFKGGPLKRVYPRTAERTAGNIPKTGPYAAP
jgi:hypothetical protein